MRHVDEIAMFGGTPLFTKPRSVGQLAMPDIDEYLAMVRGAFDARTLSGNGPIVQQLELALACYHQVEHCIAVANAGLALTMLMLHLADGTAGEVIMPAFSFRGLPHFAQWAAQLPRFCDVEESSHALSVRSVSKAIGSATTSILAVNNFNGPGDIAGLVQLAGSRGVPIFFDSVYGVGSTYNGRPLGGFGCAEVFSLHATKLLNGFEGGYITTNDPALARAFRGHRDSEDCNVGLNELHAAMALLSVRDLDAVTARNKARFSAYEAICADIAGLQLISYTTESVAKATFQMAVVEVREPWPLSRDETIRLLRAEGAVVNGYYSPPLHRSIHCPPTSIAPDLPVSESLATRFVQLPVGEGVSLSDIEQLGELLRFVSHNAVRVRSKLHASATA